MNSNKPKQDKISPDNPAEKTKREQKTSKQNPNPRANANVPEEQDRNTKQTEGVGSEITDGEDG